MSSDSLKLTLIKSSSGRLLKHKATLSGLGLRKIRQTVVVKNTDCIRGMVNKIAYLLHVEEC